MKQPRALRMMLLASAIAFLVLESNETVAVAASALRVQSPPAASTARTECTVNCAASTCRGAAVYATWAHKTFSSADTSPNASTLASAASWSCSLYVSDVSLIGGDFQAETALTCTGSITYMKTHQQYLRSSWSGPRGYTGWATSTSDPPPTQDRAWYINCGIGGTYDYSQWAYPETNQFSGGNVVSEHTIRRTCGTSP